MKRLVIKAPSRKRPTSPSNKDLDRWVQMFNDSTAKLKESVSEEAAVMAVQVGAPHFVLESMAASCGRYSSVLPTKRPSG